MRPEIDAWHFSGDEEMQTTIGNTAISDVSSSYPDYGYPGVVRLTSTDHGYKASVDLEKTNISGNAIMVQGTTNYEGMHQVVAVAENTLDIVAPYVAETPAGTENLRPGFKFDHMVSFIGFTVHLNAASATSENLVVQLDSNRGAAWDVIFDTQDMDTLSDYINMFSVPHIIEPNDEVHFSWSNTNNKLWGLTIFTQRYGG